MHKDAECIFFCSRSRLDKKILSQSGERFIPIFSGKIRRYFSWQNFVDPIFLVLGFFQALFLLLVRRPDVVFSKGGFVAVPPAFAAYLLRIPIVVHESDLVPGLSNRIIQRFAKKVLTTFPTAFSPPFAKEGVRGGFLGQARRSESSRFQWTGLPLRKSILQADEQKGRNFLHFSDSKKPIILGFGGSQGSDFLNKKLVQNIDVLLPKANMVWICGAGHESHFPERKGMRVFEYLSEEFPHVLAAADLVITRSGSSIFEVAALQKPMLLIPLASAASNHQEKNAEVFSSALAAEVLLEKDYSDAIFQKKIVDLLENSQKREELSSAAYKLVRFDAAERIAKVILS